VHLTRGNNRLILWQRNYYEHVIRGQYDWERIHLYIDSHPCTWPQDEENPYNSV
jgi:hypothetical protein